MDNEKQINYEPIAKALFENYESIYDIDMETDEYMSFHESSNYKTLKLKKKGDDFFRELKTTVEEVIFDDDIDYVMKMLDKKRIREHLERDKYYSFIYRIKRNDSTVYHQIRATIERVNGKEHLFMGIKDVDDMVRQEMKNRNEISGLKDRQTNYLKAVLSTAAAYMEADLDGDYMTEKSDGKLRKRFSGKIPDIYEISTYTGMYSWIGEQIVGRNRSEYYLKGSREYLRESFERGTKRVSVSFSLSLINGREIPCREVFFLYRNTETYSIRAFIVIYDLTRQQQKEREMKKLETELKMSRIRNFTSQMQSHFLYNALGSIQEVILIEPIRAYELLGDFSIHLRSLVSSMTDDRPIPFIKELENVRAYINIEKMRLGDKLKVEYDIKALNFEIMPLTIQPLVENAIRHGIYKKGREGGTVSISSEKTDRDYIVTIRDDGMGFDIHSFIENQSLDGIDSVGLKNIKFRLEKVMNARLEIKSTNGEGTEVKVILPKGDCLNEGDYSGGRAPYDKEI